MGQRKSKSSKTSYDVVAVPASTAPTTQTVTTTTTKTVKPPAPTPASTPSSEAAPVAKAVEVANPAAAPQANEAASPAATFPDWVNEENFTQLLKQNLPNFVKINVFKVQPALNPGENYATLLLRVSIEAELKDGSKQDLSYMLKVPPPGEMVKQMMQFYNVFVPENLMYADLLPQMEQTFKDAGKEVIFAPKSYRFPNVPEENYVLLDDLAKEGFKNVNRLECLDMKHTEAVLKKMAQFHAVSAYIVATKGPLPDVLMNGIQTEQAKGIWKGVMDSFKTFFIKNLDKYEYGEIYAEKTEKYFEQSIEVYMKLMSYNPDEFNVVNHGDHWCNNVLFKHSPEGEILETRYVDFQISKYGSPAIDLLYFIISSVNIEFKLTHFDYFIRFYHEHLIKELELLKYPKKLPTLRELHISVYEKGAWGFLTIMTTMGAVLLDPTEGATLDNFMAGDEASTVFKNLLFSNKRYVSYATEMLPWLNNRGFMDLD